MSTPTIEPAGGDWADAVTAPATAITASGAAATIDFTQGRVVFRVTLTANCTFTFNGAPADGREVRIELIQDATGSRTVTWPATVKWSGGTAPTLTTTAAKQDTVRLAYNAGTGNFVQCGSSILNLTP